MTTTELYKEEFLNFMSYNKDALDEIAHVNYDIDGYNFDKKDLANMLANIEVDNYVS